MYMCLCCTSNILGVLCGYVLLGPISNLIGVGPHFPILLVGSCVVVLVRVAVFIWKCLHGGCQYVGYSYEMSFVGRSFVCWCVGKFISNSLWCVHVAMWWCMYYVSWMLCVCIALVYVWLRCKLMCHSECVYVCVCQSFHLSLFSRCRTTLFKLPCVTLELCR